MVTSTAGVLTAVNIVTTIFMLRAPGMTMFRMPIYTWNMLVTSVLVLLDVPGAHRRARDAVLATDISVRTSSRRPSDGTPILWQHMFWFFGHPEVYIIALPFFGVVTEVFAVFSRRPVFGYKSAGLRDPRDRRPVGRRVGAPHVRDRGGAAAVLHRA